MALFVDTSALIALLDADEADHAAVRQSWESALAASRRLVSSNYVVLESLALLQRRFGMSAVRALLDGLLPLIEVHWVDEALHEASTRALRLADRRALSLVDCTSFELMRELDLHSALTLDAHFVEQGFEVAPPIEEIHEPEE